MKDCSGEPILVHKVTSLQVTVALLLCLATSTYAQISSESVERHFITGSRAAALGDAIAADATDVRNMCWNPSSLSFLQERSVAVNYSLERIRGRDNRMNENVVASVLEDGDFSAGLGLTYSHVGYIEPGSPLTGYSFIQGSLDLAVAAKLTRFLSIGAVSTIRHGRVESQNVTVLSSSVGAMYFPSPEISYGLSFQGIGNGVDYLLDSASRRTTVSKMKLPKSLEVGVTTRFNALLNRPTAVLTAGSQKMFGTKGLIYKVGVEGWPISFFCLRLGYWVGTETVSARYGSGLRLGPWQLDYALSATELEPQYHQFSLSYCFDNHKSRH